MTHSTAFDPSRAAVLISRLQERLLSLDLDDSALPSAEIEKTAKAINALIASVENAGRFLRDQDATARLGDRLTGPSRQELLRKIKRMVENGVLDELDD